MRRSLSPINETLDYLSPLSRFPPEVWKRSGEWELKKWNGRRGVQVLSSGERERHTRDVQSTCRAQHLHNLSRLSLFALAFAFVPKAGKRGGEWEGNRAGVVGSGSMEARCEPGANIEESVTNIF